MSQKIPTKSSSKSQVKSSLLVSPSSDAMKNNNSIKDNLVCEVTQK